MVDLESLRKAYGRWATSKLLPMAFVKMGATPALAAALTHLYIRVVDEPKQVKADDILDALKASRVLPERWLR